ncbi:MAG: M50 family metallopeptidase [Acetobacteraceae bacterium]|nr:M50 family metallopeptidase [Acetobacteraceae bacterium]
MAERSVWDAAAVPPGPTEGDQRGLWGSLLERVDIARYRPRRVEGYEMSEVTEGGTTYYVLKNPRLRTYVRLTAEDKFLWDQMDGQNSVRDLVLSSFLEFGGLKVGRILGLVANLQDKGLLDTPPARLYDGLIRRLRQRTLVGWLNRLWAAFLQKELPLRNIDGLLSRVIPVFRPFLSVPARIVYGVIALVGVVAFILLLRSGNLSLLAFGRSFGVGFAVLYVSQLAIVFVHEASHALMCKYYGCTVPKGGAMLYMGNLAFYIDTTDVWTKPRAARIMVSLAGPGSGAVIGGICALVALAAGEGTVAELSFKLATVGFAGAVFNLNPLLELDGYYLLMDLVGIPGLRRKALAFLTRGLKEKLARRERLHRSELTLAMFGLLCGGWTVFIIFMVILGYKNVILNLSARLFMPSAWWSRVLVGLALVLMAVPLSLALLGRFLATAVGIAEALDRRLKVGARLRRRKAAAAGRGRRRRER